MNSDTAQNNSFRTFLQQKFALRIVRNRADCPQCEGSSRLTMSVNPDWAFCHRCRFTIQFRRLAPELVPTPTPEERAERAREREFCEWLDAAYWTVCNHLIKLTMIAGFAKRTLALDPNNEIAWTELADLYHAEAVLMAALDQLAFAKLSEWLEFPMTRQRLRAAFDNTCATLTSGEKRR
jgi:hypothetical protein